MYSTYVLVHVLLIPPFSGYSCVLCTVRFTIFLNYIPSIILLILCITSGRLFNKSITSHPQFFHTPTPRSKFFLNKLILFRDTFLHPQRFFLSKIRLLSARCPCLTNVSRDFSQSCAYLIKCCIVRQNRTRRSNSC